MMEQTRTKKTSTMNISTRSFVWTTLFLVAVCSSCTTAFTPSSTSGAVSSLRVISSSKTTAWLASGSGSVDDDITRLQSKARLLLEKSKAKLASKSGQAAPTESAAAAKADSALPFFATAERVRNVIKNRNAETGLVTADGERMAALSEEEEWEARSLLEVFENEMDENEDVYSLASQQLASRDVAASIFDLRKELQTDDYQKIFNKRNPFIGEDN